jgi:LDH2 family malate/lactate/ureidoglycolate dehydrogenase
LVRVAELESFSSLDPSAHPVLLDEGPAYQRWSGNGALGYLTLAAVCDAQIARPPERVRLVVAERCFPTGALGHWVRRLARAGLMAALTATSPARLAHPDGGPALTGTNPLAIAIPSSEGDPVVADVSMAKATWGDVLAGRATEDDVTPFGGEQAYKAFALAVGLELLVRALAGEGFGAVLLVVRPEHDPVPAFRRLAAAVRLPGDR